MSLMASLVTTSQMKQCFDVLIDIYHEFLLLCYCCVLLVIKLTTATNALFRISPLQLYEMQYIPYFAFLLIGLNNSAYVLILLSFIHIKSRRTSANGLIAWLGGFQVINYMGDIRMVSSVVPPVPHWIYDSLTLNHQDICVILNFKKFYLWLTKKMYLMK